MVQPGSLLEQWQVLQACVAADKIVILQAANTGLTEGLHPQGQYDRDVVLINTRRMDRLHSLDGGRQVLALPGATLFALEKMLKPLGRQPHSVIGSSCIGASVMGGVCNNSGGSLVERGPSYTELSLYARINEDGQIELVNHLGIRLGETPEEILTRLEAGDFDAADFEATNSKASDTDYVPACAMSTRTHPRGSTPTSGGFTNRRAARASWRSLPCGWTPTRSRKARRPSISAPTTRAS